VNQLYNNAAYRMSVGAFNWLATDILLVAWGGAPDYNAADLTIAQIKARGNVELGGPSLPVTGQTVAPDGTCQTNVVIIPDIAPGETVTWFTLCDRKSPHDSSQPILYLDEVVDLPYDGNGLDMAVQPDWLTQRGWFRP
jgi:hypothetical protein